MYEVIPKQVDIKARPDSKTIRDPDWQVICDVMGRMLENPEITEIVVRKITAEDSRCGIAAERIVKSRLLATS